MHRTSVLLLALAATVVGTEACTHQTSRMGSLELVASNAQALVTLDHVTVTVSASDIPQPLVSNLTYANGRWTGTVDAVPAGDNRDVHGDAYDASGKVVFTGDVAYVSVTDTAPAIVDLILQDTSPAAPAFSSVVPIIDGMSASTGALAPSGHVALSVTAHDAAGETLTYAWSATDGSFDDAKSATPNWTAPPLAETVTISVAVSDSKGIAATMSLPMIVGNGSVLVGATFNTSPSVTLVTANPTRIEAGIQTVVSATATDPDGDTLSYEWASDCGGEFAAWIAQTYFVTANPPGATCTLTVTVTDGRGGSGQGSLQIQVAPPPPVMVPPVVDNAYQSLFQADGCQVVELRVQAHDPQGGPLAFLWNADQGTLGAATTSDGTSDVMWTAPAALGSAATVTVSMTDSRSDQTSYWFTIPTSGVQSTSCP